MNVDSIFFISCFLPIALAIYMLVPRLRGKNIVLLALGLLFYSFGSISGIITLVAAALVNYLLGLWLQGKKRRKAAVVIGVVGNLAFLAVYKYLDFLLAEVLGLPQLKLGLAVPLGISFFTFKSISYLIDTYRARENGTRSFFDLLLYISFFPQVMAGPIARFVDFKPQLKAREITWGNTACGLRRFTVGLAKKLIIAGTLGSVVDDIFALEGANLDIRLAWLGAIGYSLQIYFDFSGYSDMAIGLGSVFGFKTKENFDHPYIAPTIGNFWRRWHISLSSWFKDYLYIPLGGSRKGTFRTGLNKAIVFTLCGIWHGANWTFLIWGAWHGILSAFESYGIIPAKRLEATKGGRVLGRIYTLLAVVLGFVMFRAATVESGFAIIGAMFSGFSFTDVGTVLFHRLFNAETVVTLIIAILFSMPINSFLSKFKKLQPVSEALSFIFAVILLVICILKMASGGFAPFIYAQF